ncbi:ABC transporter ATP-binding protein [Hyphomicrobium sp. CS1GBMeth3]|uniref:ABC transporter ATP-binding protein n=1 Tax=Hyphomicrobium sp. CS1GBMeth3 TaxID=1892845 RepID=UPI0009314440|nr:ABC transporter ATP-binding protein [Hyphomicrobium sp. CS1GBMeth3]
MLALRNLTVGFDPDRDVLSGLDLTVEAGGAVVVTGAAGSGKSTLIAVASGLIPKLIRPRRMDGQVLLNGDDIAKLSTSDLYRRVGIVLQSVEDQVWDLTVEDLIAFPLENRGVPKAEVRTRVSAVIEEMCLQRLVGRTVRSLSGGERRIVALASSLLWKPDLLVLDEPTTGLDPDARARLAAILQKLRRDGITLLVAEQDLAWCGAFADRVVFLSGGRLIGTHAWSGSAELAERCDAAGVTSPFAAQPAKSERPAQNAEPALRISELSSKLTRPDGTPVLSALNLIVPRGQVVGVIGPNGAGKSTLMRSLLGLQAAATGGIEIAGEDSSGWTVARRAQRVGYVAQNLKRMFFLLTALDEVVFSLSGGATGAKAVAAHREQALALLVRVRLAEKADLSPFALSTREQLMLALVCIEATKPSVVILDEPLIACDKAWRADVLAFLDRARADNCSVLLVSHDLPLIDSATDRVLILERGAIAHDGRTDEVWQSDAFVRLGWPVPGQAVAPPRQEGRYALA